MSLKASEDFPFFIYLQQEIKVKIGITSSSMKIQQFLSVFYYTVYKLALHF